MPDIKTLIQNIKIKNNLSRNDLAKILGVSSATVKRWEYGTMPSFDNIKKLQNINEHPSTLLKIAEESDLDYSSIMKLGDAYRDMGISFDSLY